MLLPPESATLRIPYATSSCRARSVADRSQLRLKHYLIPCEMWPFWILPNIYRSHILNLIMTRFHPLFTSYFDANNRFIHVILAFYQQKLKTNLTNYPIFHKQFRLKNIWGISHILFTSSYFFPTSPQTLIHGYFSLLFCLSVRRNKKGC